MSKQPGEPRKIRWTVPAADASVTEWLDVQQNISLSLRQLIRESIQRDGYIDVAYRPVEQLPRRGRPPLADAVGDGDGDGDRDATEAADGETDVPRLSEPVVDVGAPAGEPPEAPSGDLEEKALHTRPAPAAGGQVDMEDIFGHGG
ncbi:hypothetical protein ACFRAU_07380 [Arthrobacter sp. NPDC056691]|uniref:hypothetical protein n=1 Tax=Arthrobacter sp. NPDC056691 TaxID=3345913 RepID=UPI00366A7875